MDPGFLPRACCSLNDSGCGSDLFVFERVRRLLLPHVSRGRALEQTALNLHRQFALDSLLSRVVKSQNRLSLLARRSMIGLTD